MNTREEFHNALMELLISQKSIAQNEAKSIMEEFEAHPTDGLIDFLIDEGLVDEFDLLRALSIFYQVPPCDVLGLFVDTQLLRKFPKDFLLRNYILPIEVEGNIMIVVVADPHDETLLEKIGEHVSYDIQFQVGIAGDIADAIKEFYEESDTEMKGTDFDPEEIDVEHDDIDDFIDEEIAEIEEDYFFD